MPITVYEKKNGKKKVNVWVNFVACKHVIKQDVGRTKILTEGYPNNKRQTMRSPIQG